MTTSIEQVERRLAKLEEEKKQLQARKKSIIARQKSKERKQRNHMLIVIGAMVEKHFGGIENISMKKLDKYFTKYENALTKAAVKEYESVAQAYQACRDYESEIKEKAKIQKEETKRLQQELLEDERFNDEEPYDYEDVYYCLNCGTYGDPNYPCRECGGIEFALDNDDE